MDQDIKTPTTQPGYHTTIGNIAALFMLGLAIITGGWYLLTKETTTQWQEAPSSSMTNNVVTPVVDAPTQALKQQGTSDDVSAIEADLNATDLSSLNDINKI